MFWTTFVNFTKLINAIVTINLSLNTKWNFKNAGQIAHYQHVRVIFACNLLLFHAKYRARRSSNSLIALWWQAVQASGGTATGAWYSPLRAITGQRWELSICLEWAGHEYIVLWRNITWILKSVSNSIVLKNISQLQIPVLNRMYWKYLAQFLVFFQCWFENVLSLISLNFSVRSHSLALHIFHCLTGMLARILDFTNVQICVRTLSSLAWTTLNTTHLPLR